MLGDGRRLRDRGSAGWLREEHWHGGNAECVDMLMGKYRVTGGGWPTDAALGD